MLISLHQSHSHVYYSATATSASCFAMASPLATVVFSVLLLSIGISSAHAGRINIRNQCPFVLTACHQAQQTGVSCFVLGQRGGSREIDVGSRWIGGLIWGLPSGSGDSNQGNLAKPQANLAEFTIGVNNQDSYDLSNVDAYNLPLMINPTYIAGGGKRDGTHCGTLSCTIDNLNSFCRSPNYLTGGPGNGCKNRDGPGLVPTAGTRMFKDRCPTSYSYSQDDKNQPGVVYGCNTGSNYEVVFCPNSRIQSWLDKQ